MSKINLHELMKKNMQDSAKEKAVQIEAMIGQGLADICSTCFISGYSAALNDLQGKVDEMIELLESIQGGYSVYEQEGQTFKIMKKEYPETIRAKEYLQALAEFKNKE